MANEGRAGLPGPEDKRAFDLVLTAGGIKRRVIECRSVGPPVPEVRHAFVPEQLPAAGQALPRPEELGDVPARRPPAQPATRVQDDARGVLRAPRVTPEVHHVQVADGPVLPADLPAAAQRRSSPGSLLHIDETEVKLQTGKGYVWVFTNLEEVVTCTGRPGRGTSSGAAQGLHGVLVSDFYAAYDSPRLPAAEVPDPPDAGHEPGAAEQPLRRGTPVDHPARSAPCCVRSSTTIDEHGLKRRHLQRHKREVDEFFDALAERAFRSEAAEALRQRLLKYRDKLFTFLGHDGVPWNNNNAENAIKQFAYYREDTDGMHEGGGLRDYLVLLSIYQTCRYKGVSFLKFLASGQRDVDAFCEMKRASPGKPVLETYPEGFVRSQSPGQTATTSKMGG